MCCFVLFGSPLRWQSFALKIFHWYFTAYKTTHKPESGLVNIRCSQKNEDCSYYNATATETEELREKNWTSPTPLSFQLWVTAMLSQTQLEKQPSGSRNIFYQCLKINFFAHFEKVNYNCLWLICILLN